MNQVFISSGRSEEGEVAGWIVRDGQTAHLEFPPGVEFLQALHRLLPVHHGGYSGPLLQEEDERI